MDLNFTWTMPKKIGYVTFHNIPKCATPATKCFIIL